MDSDRRRHPRYEVMAQVRVLRGTVTYVLDVSNISVSGLFVSTLGLPRMPWFRRDQQIELDVFVPEELENIRVLGCIVRLEEDEDGASRGFGVQFVDVDKGTQIKIDRLVGLAKARSVHPPPLPGMVGGEKEGIMRTGRLVVVASCLCAAAGLGCDPELGDAFDDVSSATPSVCSSYCQESIDCEWDQNGPVEEEAQADAIDRCALECAWVAENGSYVYDSQSDLLVDQLSGGAMMKAFECIWGLDVLACRVDQGYSIDLSLVSADECMALDDCVSPWDILFGFHWQATQFASVCVPDSTEYPTDWLIDFTWSQNGKGN